MGERQVDDRRGAVWKIVLLAAGGVGVARGSGLGIRHDDRDPATEIVLETRYENIGTSEPVPRELVFEVTLAAEDLMHAVVEASAISGGFTAVLSFVCNAYLAVPEARLGFDATPGLDRRDIWQTDLPLETGTPRPTRMLREDVLYPFLESLRSCAEANRVRRAIGQYHAAMRDWTPAGRPLAFSHLYMALEALGPAVERVERARLGIGTDNDHAERHSVDVSRRNWKEVLLGRIRRDIICEGDRQTYDTARKASDGFEHGSEDSAHLKVAAEQCSDTLLGYVRRGILGLLALPSGPYQKLAGYKPLDVNPTRFSVTGYLTGEVSDPDRLGRGGRKHPELDLTVRVDDYRTDENGNVALKPRLHGSSQVADGVVLTCTGYGLNFGLTDPSLMSHTPEAEMSEAIDDPKLEEGH